MELQPLKKFSITPYRVSTITATASVDACVELNALFNSIRIGDAFPDLKFVEYGGTKCETQYKGQSLTKTKHRGKKPVKKRFDNQMTLHFFRGGARYNVKLFKNGNIQMTGIKDIEAGSHIVNQLIDIIRHNSILNSSIVADPALLKNEKMKICLANCDFKLGFNVDRNSLHEILSKRGFKCSYEPCIYQGVKLSYFLSDSAKGGICCCPQKCTGRGPNSVCTKITVAFFQSGSVTIIGAKDMAHLNMMHKFVEYFMKEHLVGVQQKFYAPMASRVSSPIASSSPVL